MSASQWAGGERRDAKHLVSVVYSSFLSDKTCHRSTYDGYGITVEEGSTKNRLKGAGVFDAPGVAHMGGRTPFRSVLTCRVIPL